MKNKEKEYCLILVNKLSKKRMKHVLSVVKEADRLARKYGADVERCRLAALLHDSAKELPLAEMQALLQEDRPKELQPSDYSQGEILHGFAGARLIAKQFGICDSEILEAISYHTIGRKGLSLLGKIVYIADAIEEGRSYPAVEALRKAVYEDLDYGILEELRHKESYLSSLGIALHPNTLAWKQELEERYERA